LISDLDEKKILGGTKHKNTSVVSDFDGKKKILGSFHWKFAILRTLNGEIQMIEGHYFKIVSTIYSSNGNSFSSGFYYATHLMWLQKWHPCSTRDCGYKRYGFGLLDVHVQSYTNILYMFWFLRKF
jgi:hypothetical protein